MFTFKKLAIVGVAGLAAFAMSCSDSDSDEAGGTITGFAVTDDPTGVELSGVITANVGAQIKTLTVKAGSNTLSLAPAPVLPATTLNLSTYGVGGVCNGGLVGVQSLKFEVTVEFNEGGKLVESKTASIDCGTGNPSGGETLNIWSSFKLSSAGTSYADIDAKQALGQTAALAALETIDLIAYSGHAGVDAGKIYTIWDIDALDATDGGSVFFPIAATDVPALKTAATTTDIAAFLAKVPGIVEDDDNEIEGGVTIAADAAILVLTATGDVYKGYAVIVTGTGTNEVTLKSISLY
jgi:hypothetical protein